MHTLADFRAAVVARGYDVRLVGGCVRDRMLGLSPKDIDLATDMTPDEQVLTYLDLGLRFVLTGLQHGTITVIIGDAAYEVTSLRTESDHDGRYAQMTFTRDWIADLARRDLTVNAMAETFDGEIIDPFGGAADLAAGRIVFVGSARERIREDYLRILRWFRFHGRLAGGKPLDPATGEAVREMASGLSQISRERVWMEMQKIVVGPNARAMIDAVVDLGVAPFIDLDIARSNVALMGEGAATTRMVALLGGVESRVAALADEWRWSKAERDIALYVARKGSGYPDLYREMALHDKPREFVIEIARYQNRPEAEIALLQDWEVPHFPVGGGDLTAIGVAPGPKMGAILNALRTDWADTGYVLGRDQLLAGVSP
jgi:tRNA nucleotidyltransferase (CCA-adding enzyme)